MGRDKMLNDIHNNISRNISCVFRLLSSYFTPSELCCRLKITNKCLNQLIKKGDIDLPTFSDIASKMNVTTERLCSNSVDIKCLISALKNEPYTVPIEYQSNQTSLRNTTIAILSHIHQDVAQVVMRHFQIAPDYLHIKNIYKTTSPELNRDIVHYLDEYWGLAPDLLGRQTFYHYLSTRIYDEVAGLNNKECFEKLIEIVKKDITASYQYGITKLNNKEIVIQRKLKEDVPVDYSAKVCDFEFASISTLPAFHNKVFLKGNKTRCQSRGDSYAEFAFNIETPVSVLAM